jgi:general secretion pathway protein L
MWQTLADTVITKPARLAMQGSAWLLSELSGCVPNSVRNWARKDPREVLLYFNGTGVAIDYPDASPFTWSDVERVLRGLQRRWPGLLSIILVVPKDACFEREVAVPHAALANATSILTLDIERTTPFRLTEVYAGVYRAVAEANENMTYVRQVILHRTYLSEATEGLGRLGLPIRSVRVMRQDMTFVPIDLLEPREMRRAPVSVALARLMNFAAIASVIGMVAWLCASVWRYENALKVQSDEIALAAKSAQVVRQKLAQSDDLAQRRQEVRLRKLEQTPIAQTWEDLAKALPNSAWLTDLAIENGIITLSGFATNASQLIGALARSPRWSAATFAAPVTRDPQRNVERFQITIKTGNAGVDAKTP